MHHYHYCKLHSTDFVLHFLCKFIYLFICFNFICHFCREQPIEGFLDDYSFLIKGLIDFYVATLDVDALKWAKDLQDTQDRLFWDNERGGYFYSQANSANLVVRLKEGPYN